MLKHAQIVVPELYFSTADRLIIICSYSPQPTSINKSSLDMYSWGKISQVWTCTHGEKLTHILKSLAKSAPPVIIFCENKRDVDKVHEYLLLKGIDAVSIHGGKDQSERNKSIEQFKV